jgi:hypothetical protein
MKAAHFQGRQRKGANNLRLRAQSDLAQGWHASSIQHLWRRQSKAIGEGSRRDDLNILSSGKYPAFLTPLFLQASLFEDLY